MKYVFISIFILISLFLFPIEQNFITSQFRIIWASLGTFPFNLIAFVASVVLFFKDKKWKCFWLLISIYTITMVYFVTKAEGEWWKLVDGGADLDIYFELSFFRTVYFGVLLPLLLILTRFIWLNRCTSSNTYET